MPELAVPAEQDAFEDLGFLSDIYLDFDDVGGLDFFQDPPSVADPSPAVLDAPAEEAQLLVMDDIEQFLMKEDSEGGEEEDEWHLTDDFFAEVFFSGSDEGSVRSAASNGDAASPEEREPEGKEKSEGEGNAVALALESEKGTDGDESENKGGEADEDLLTKKRTRQMRNRDSAMKSRERKKMYVRDLEVKSKYLESELRRLQHALNCCAAENISLRQCLEKARTFGAPLAKQESAVLFVESLLLGSLFWLVSIARLFLMPSLPIEKIEKASVVTSRPRRMAETKGPENRILGWKFSYKGRGCKSLRRKMRVCLFPLGLVGG